MTAAALAAAFKRRYGIAPPPGYRVDIASDGTAYHYSICNAKGTPITGGYTSQVHSLAAAKREVVEALRLLTAERAA